MWRDGGRRAAAATRDEPVAGGRTGAAGSSELESAYARLSVATRGQFPSASASILAVDAAARSRRRHRRRAQSPPTPTLRAPPPPNLQRLIGCRPRRLPGNAVPGLGRGGRKEEEASQRGGKEGPERQPEM